MRFFFRLWFFLTVLHQFPLGRKVTSQIDPYQFLVPIWTCFGPFPGTTDAEIVVRTFNFKGEASSWTHIPIYEDRKSTHWLIHRNRRLEKLVFDCVGHIQSLVSDDVRPANIVASPPYIILLSIVMAIADIPDDACSIQFMVVDSSGYISSGIDSVPKFASAIHSLR